MGRGNGVRSFEEADQRHRLIRIEDAADALLCERRICDRQLQLVVAVELGSHVRQRLVIEDEPPIAPGDCGFWIRDGGGANVLFVHLRAFSAVDEHCELRYFDALKRDEIFGTCNGDTAFEHGDHGSRVVATHVECRAHSLSHSVTAQHAERSRRIFRDLEQCFALREPYDSRCLTQFDFDARCGVERHGRTIGESHDPLLTDLCFIHVARAVHPEPCHEPDCDDCETRCQRHRQCAFARALTTRCGGLRDVGAQLDDAPIHFLRQSAHRDAARAIDALQVAPQTFCAQILADVDGRLLEPGDERALILLRHIGCGETHDPFRGFIDHRLCASGAESVPHSVSLCSCACFWHAASPFARYFFTIATEIESSAAIS